MSFTLFFRRLCGLFRRGQVERDMAEEMRLHLELQAEKNMAAGMNAEEAHFAAKRQFGGIEQIKEVAREQRGFLWLEHTFQNVRFLPAGYRRVEQPGSIQSSLSVANDRNRSTSALICRFKFESAHDRRVRRDG